MKCSEARVKPLSWLAERYCALHLGITARYADHLRRAVRDFSSWLGRAASIDTLTVDLLADFLAKHLTTHSTYTTNAAGRRLVTLWNFAAEQRICRRPPRQIHWAREPRNIPEAWTAEECDQIFRECRNQPGKVNQRPAADWWLSLAHTIYWTGARIGAILQCPPSSYAPMRGLIVAGAAQKNRTGQWFPLPPETCIEIERIMQPELPAIWSWDKTPRWFNVIFRRIVERAGVPCRRGKSRELFHRMRRTNLSYCAADDPAIAQRQAGHSSYATTQRSYIDPRIAQQKSAIDVLPKPKF